MTTIQIERLKTDDEVILEAWARVTDEPSLLGVKAIRLPDESWPWQIFVSLAESVYAEPFESQMVSTVTKALEGVAGVECVECEERGLWVVDGSVKGSELVEAVAVVVDTLARSVRQPSE